MEQRFSILNNFIKRSNIWSLFQECKLTFVGCFMLSNQYYLQLVDYKVAQHLKQAKSVQEKLVGVDTQAYDAEERMAKAPSKDIKGKCQAYTAMTKELKQLGLTRMAAGIKSRAYKRKSKKRGTQLYRDLAIAPKSFSKVYMKRSKSLHDMRESQSKVFALNKKINGKLIPAQGPLIDVNIMPTLADPFTSIQGIDLGVVTVAPGVATSLCFPFEAVNRFQAISDDQTVPHSKDALAEAPKCTISNLPLVPATRPCL
ncbi:uncharacterized protein ATC70_002329 [Mucor velutinosus]|uniref:Uncharacterized protein n=1 Tax=Mucor velutinosus TaxID=708070 RepID=A0AAN7DC44_9FUNG|nr:hypothetical protein ATC70_002329 [Mucor velutinosus]